MRTVVRFGGAYSFPAHEDIEREFDVLIEAMRSLSKLANGGDSAIQTYHAVDDEAVQYLMKPLELE